MTFNPIHITIKVAIAALVSLQLSTAFAEWAQGQVRKVDQGAQKLTIKHGEIKSIDMPPMTMVFYVREADLLNGVQANDAIEFQAITEGSKFVVTALRKKAP
jgi:Cu(I)/Ag(I) efflux system protein CusF